MTKKRATNEERTTNKKGIECILPKVGSIITILSTVFTFVLAIFKSYRSYSYAEKATEFYGIPKYYFLEKNSSNIASNIIVFVAILFILCLPILFLKRNGKNEISKSVAWIVSIEVGVISALLFFYFISVHIFNVTDISSDNTTIKRYLLLGAMLIFIIAYICIIYSYFKNNFKIVSYKKMTNSEGEDDQKKSRSFNNYIIFFILIILISIYFIYDNEVTEPVYINKYEIVKLEDGTTKMIISHRCDKAILMDYISLNQDGNLDESGNNIIIDKGHYSLESIDGKPIEFKKFASVSNDNYESYKKENTTVK